ncbi:MAG: hypothetical protein EOO28_36015 [Comamonadaceae bacterium]|nr:MAG: hypothetical protein EOO28_36015 [Comamonadaceae bacterium]
MLALLVAQSLGFVHRVVHHMPAPLAAASQGLKAPAAQPSGMAAAPVAAAGFLASLFQHNEDDPSCRVFDQAGSADALACPAAAVLPMALSSFVLLFFQGEVLARWVALFDARGPPSVR